MSRSVWKGKKVNGKLILHWDQPDLINELKGIGSKCRSCELACITAGKRRGDITTLF